MSPPGDIAQALLDCLETAYLDVPEAQRPGQICLRVGTVPYSIGTAEDLCCTGLAWVRILRIYPSTNFPVEDAGALVCPGSAYAVELEMGAVRCLPDHGTQSGATCEEWTAAFLAVDQDAATMRKAVCCMQDQLSPPIGELFVPGTWTPVDGQGGCIGGTMTVTYGFDCLECPT